MTDFHSTLCCEGKIRRRIESYKPDVIVSVHPAMNNVPMIATRKLSQKEGRHIPFFTYVMHILSLERTLFFRRELLAHTSFYVLLPRPIITT